MELMEYCKRNRGLGAGAPDRDQRVSLQCECYSPPQMVNFDTVRETGRRIAPSHVASIRGVRHRLNEFLPRSFGCRGRRGHRHGAVDMVVAAKIEMRVPAGRRSSPVFAHQR